MNEIIVAVISGLCVAIPSIYTTLKSSKANNELLEYKIGDLKEVDRFIILIRRNRLN